MKVGWTFCFSQQMFYISDGNINTMKMDKVANSGNDEFYTPPYAIRPIMKYIDNKRERGSKIWCPFDTEDSLFVKCFELTVIK